MNSETSCRIDDDIVVPESALLRREHRNKYGSVPGLENSELADPAELERQVFKQEFGPVLTLPVTSRKGSIRPTIDQEDHLDWGAFGTIDFERYSSGFDKLRYKADKLREQRKDVLIIFSIVNERVYSLAKYWILKYLNIGMIELKHIVNSDMLALARLFLRAERLRQQITELHEVGKRHQQREIMARWDS